MEVKTPREAVDVTIWLLGTMKIRADELETNGEIVKTAIHNLRLVSQTLEKAEQEAAASTEKKEETTDDPGTEAD